MKISCVSLVAFFLAGCLAALSDAMPKPNIVLILADDMGWGDPQCYNPDSKIPTPNLDRLAKEGMRFTDAHSSAATCIPSRYGILTGRARYRRSWDPELTAKDLKDRLVTDTHSLIADGRLTLPAMLKEQGYHTAMVGKWHLGYQWVDAEKKERFTQGPTDRGFDSYFGIVGSANIQPFAFFENGRTVGTLTQGTYPCAEYNFERRGWGTEGWDFQQIQPTLTRKAIDYISQEERTEPFFLYLAFGAPHTPYTPSTPFKGKSGADSYGDLAHEVDWSVGQILKALEEKGLAENTLVIFTSDNGSPEQSGSGKGNGIDSLEAATGHMANGYFRGTKGTTWEGGHRVPFIIRWPGKIKAGSVNNHMLCLTDLMASFAALTDYALPENTAEDSINLLPEWLGNAPENGVRQVMLNHSEYRQCAVRDGNWKMIYGTTSGWPLNKETVTLESEAIKGQLYNLETDPGEQKNLWLQYPEKVQSFDALLEKIKINRAYE